MTNTIGSIENYPLVGPLSHLRGVQVCTSEGQPVTDLKQFEKTAGCIFPNIPCLSCVGGIRGPQGQIVRAVDRVVIERPTPCGITPKSWDKVPS